MGQEFRKSALDGGAQAGLFRFREKSNSPIGLALASDARSRVALDFFVVDAHAKDQRECRLPSVSTAGCPISFRCLFRQPCDNFILLDGFRRTRTKDRQQLGNTKTEFVGLLFAVLRLAVLQSVLT